MIIRHSVLAAFFCCFFCWGWWRGIIRLFLLFFGFGLWTLHAYGRWGRGSRCWFRGWRRCLWVGQCCLFWPIWVRLETCPCHFDRVCWLPVLFLLRVRWVVIWWVWAFLRSCSLAFPVCMWFRCWMCFFVHGSDVKYGGLIGVFFYSWYFLIIFVCAVVPFAFEFGWFEPVQPCCTPAECSIYW